MPTYISRKWTMAKKAAAKNKINSFRVLYNETRKEFDADRTLDSQPDEKLEKIERAVWGKFSTEIAKASSRKKIRADGWEPKTPNENSPSNPSTAGGTAASQTGESAKPAGAEKATKELAGPPKNTPPPIAEPPKDPSKSHKPVCTFFSKGARRT